MSEKWTELPKKSTLSAGDSPARTCRSQTGEVEDWRATRAGSGVSMPESLMSCDQQSSSLKTCPDWYGGAWTSLSTTSTGAVTRWRQVASERKTSGPHTDASDCSSWATPTVHGNYNRASPTSGDGLATQTKQWPTPCATDSHGGHKRRRLTESLRDGVLNPEWVEMLMGFSPGWTDPDESNGQTKLFTIDGR